MHCCVLRSLSFFIHNVCLRELGRIIQAMALFRLEERQAPAAVLRTVCSACLNTKRRGPTPAPHFLQPELKRFADALADTWGPSQRGHRICKSPWEVERAIVEKRPALEAAGGRRWPPLLFVLALRGRRNRGRTLQTSPTTPQPQPQQVPRAPVPQVDRAVPWPCTAPRSPTPARRTPTPPCRT